MHTTTGLAALAALLTVTNGHMMMKTPVPYGKSSLTNSPLAGDGSDFPCKQRSGVYDLEGASNVMAIGEPQTLSFTGSAVHGGGSCQVSLTKDLQPSKSSTWMVIHSIEGGCPADTSGNLPENANGDGAATFQYTIPQGIDPGNYTIAWSWLNKIGNREYYMNCGPATVTAASKKRYAPAPKLTERDTTFPALFVANLNGVSNGCTTEEGKDIVYPDPGQSVQKSSDGNFGPPNCGNSTDATASAAPPSQATVAAGGASASSSASSGSGSTSSGSGSSGSGSGSSGSGSGSSGSDSGSGSAGSGSGMGSGSSSASSASSASATAAPGTFASGAASASPVTSSAAAAPSAVAPAASAAGTGSSSPSTAGSLSGACTSEGAWNCLGGSSYQRCASGQWSAPQQMASGTTCQGGQSDTLNMTAAKRAVKGKIVRKRLSGWGN